MSPRLAALLPTAVFLAHIALAGPPQKTTAPVDKSQYHLFNPVPAEAMRELTPDRPDKTESPFTVDAGHVQVEMDLANFSYDRHNPERTDTRVESWSFGTMNIKLGLLNHWDLELVVSPYNSVRTAERPNGPITRNQGFGDFTIRTKVNFWGDEGDSTTAFGVIGFVKLPTAQDDLGNDAVEGGIILPLSISLPGGWGIGVMTEVDLNEDGDGHGTHAEWTNSISISKDLTEKLGCYVEFFSTVTSERHAPWVGTADVGVTYAVTDNLSIDTGVNFGLTRSADDVNPFVGLTVRF